jgi:hypothetical protein
VGFKKLPQVISSSCPKEFMELAFLSSKVRVTRGMVLVMCMHVWVGSMWVGPLIEQPIYGYLAWPACRCGTVSKPSLTMETTGSDY